MDLERPEGQGGHSRRVIDDVVKFRVAQLASLR